MRSYPIEVEGSVSKGQMVEAPDLSTATYVACRGLREGAVFRLRDGSGWWRVFRVERRRPRGIRLDPPAEQGACVP